jgi:hypothetical protein
MSLSPSLTHTYTHTHTHTHIFAYREDVQLDHEQRLSQTPPQAPTETQPPSQTHGHDVSQPSVSSRSADKRGGTGRGGGGGGEGGELDLRGETEAGKLLLGSVPRGMYINVCVVGGGGGDIAYRAQSLKVCVCVCVINVYSHPRHTFSNVGTQRQKRPTIKAKETYYGADL